MPIVLIRIDDRLIHGQIVEGWLKVIDAEKILVANDSVSCDKMQKTLLMMATPRSVELEIVDIDSASKILNGSVKGEEKILVLLSSIKDAFRLIEKGADISSINIGGLHFSEGKKQFFKSISFSEEDIEYIKKIANMGVELEIRILPNDEKIDIIEHLKQKGESE